ncbi:MAG: aminopeptidase [Desulfovibrionaceae bacterium]|nr:aminopeptidase [Desulfovibrionaceae bacterium]
MKKAIANKMQNIADYFATKEQSEQMQQTVASYIDFLSCCKTERETIAYLIEHLEKHRQTSSKDTIFYKQWREKSLFIAKKGKRPLSEGLHLIASHADSPRLDWKQNPFIENDSLLQVKTHYYGGIRKYQWLSRPMALHGVAVKENGEQVRLCIGEKDMDPVFTISDLLPHLAQKEAGKTLQTAFEGEKLNIIFGHAPDIKNKEEEHPIKRAVLRLLKEYYGLEAEDFYSAEIQMVPAGRARYVGLDRKLIGGYGQDDKICVFTSFKAFLESAEEPEYTSCLIFWDKEEIGSNGSTGAQSRFMEYCIQEIAEQWEPEAKVRDIFLNTKALSADVSAPIEPDWEELHDANNAAYMGCGPVFCKFTGSRGKYDANDAHPEYIAWLRHVLNSQQIPWQMAELGKVDCGGGGTVALYLAAYGMDTIDLGPAIMSMHSPFELSSVYDIYTTKEAYRAFLNAK